jgi:transposase
MPPGLTRRNDRNDAEAICEAASRPGMTFVLAKPADRQAEGMVLKVRETLVGQRTQLINALRGHAAVPGLDPGIGVIAAKGTGHIPLLLATIEADAEVPPIAKEMAALLGQQIDHLELQIKAIAVKVTAMHKANELSQLLATMPGSGPIIALTMALEIDPAVFESGRHLAAWLGLTPKEHSTGGKQRMGGISRAGHERLRALLVSGATSVIRVARQPGNKLATPWLLNLIGKKPEKVAAVAPAFAGAGCWPTRWRGWPGP